MKKNPLSELKKIVQEKIEWNKMKSNSNLKAFLESNQRKDRDRVLKTNTELQAYENILEKINELEKEDSKVTKK